MPIVVGRAYSQRTRSKSGRKISQSGDQYFSGITRQDHCAVGLFKLVSNLLARTTRGDVPSLRNGAKTSRRRIVEPAHDGIRVKPPETLFHGRKGGRSLGAHGGTSGIFHIASADDQQLALRSEEH